jgi:hypothetical protein
MSLQVAVYIGEGAVLLIADFSVQLISLTVLLDITVAK